MSAAQTFDLTGGEEIDEDLFGTGEEGSEAEHTLSADDEYFDRVVAALEDIIMDDLYKQKVIKFCRDNCSECEVCLQEGGAMVTEGRRLPSLLLPMLCSAHHFPLQSILTMVMRTS